jgi:hypothetical protein
MNTERKKNCSKAVVACFCLHSRDLVEILHKIKNQEMLVPGRVLYTFKKIRSTVLQLAQLF